MKSMSEYVWSPPVYYVGEEPRLKGIFSLSPDPQFPENFVRLAKWYVECSVVYFENARFLAFFNVHYV